MPELRSYDNHSKYSNFHNYKKTNVKYKKLMQNVQSVQIAKRTHIVNIDDFTNDVVVLIIEGGWPTRDDHTTIFLIT